MAEDTNDELVVPVLSEQFHADAVPVETGGVRVIKRVEGHEEVLEQELRRGRVEVKRVKLDRKVEGPQNARRVGDTLIIPVVSEVLRVTKEWVLTEEIHVTQIEERETVQERVTVNREVASVERTDEQGNVREEVPPNSSVIVDNRPLARGAAAPSGGIVERAAERIKDAEPARRRVLGEKRSLLRDTD